MILCALVILPSLARASAPALTFEHVLRSLTPIGDGVLPACEKALADRGFVAEPFVIEWDGQKNFVARSIHRKPDSAGEDVTIELRGDTRGAGLRIESLAVHPTRTIKAPDHLRHDKADSAVWAAAARDGVVDLSSDDEEATLEILEARDTGTEAYYLYELTTTGKTPVRYYAWLHKLMHEYGAVAESKADPALSNHYANAKILW